MLAKMLPNIKRQQLIIIILVVSELLASLIEGIQAHGNTESSNKKINLRDIGEQAHKPGYGQLFYSEPTLANKYQSVQLGDESVMYNHHHQAEDRHQFDEPDYDDRLVDQQHQPSHASSEAFGETVLSSGSNATTTTDHTSRTPESMNEQQLLSGNKNIDLVDKTMLTRELIKRICQLDRGSQRSEQLNNTYLTNCMRYRLENLLSNEILMFIMHEEARTCEKILEEFVQLDETINQFDSLFMKLLSRYNCHNGYSVKWNCDDCKKAYKDWLCSTHLPLYMNGELIKPCISFCERVEQRCPYLHPITREQYGGQPVFICRDPNIPFVPAITPDIPYSEPGKCYDLCHLSDNLTELVIDSLSKYDYDKCPDRGSIAGEVRNEQIIQNELTKPPQPADTGDYPDMTFPDDENSIAVLANRTAAGAGKATQHVHNKKLEELREVLANYKNQAKTHRYHADHSSVDHQSKAQSELHTS